MKKFWLLLGLLFLVGCSEGDKTTIKTFELSDEIHKISVTGNGLISYADNSEAIFDREIVFENVSDIQKLKDAVQNAPELTGPVTNVGPLFVLELTFESGYSEVVDLWYYTEVNKGHFGVDDVMYHLNDDSVPQLIELFESYREQKVQ
ncbi:hypothetical protein ACIQ2D_21265 [Lysinibacillus sp. NPDC097287]|uniref:hypothetical protein n=1 Tax=Lysinibacillus sp. NPDC097287 TaxID=3364144 RepID=UPI0038198A10